MKRVTKVLSFVFLALILFTRVCFADVIMMNEDPRNHGMGRYDNWENTYINTYVNRYENNQVNQRNRTVEYNDDEFDTDIIKVIVIAVLVLTIIICATIITLQIIKTGKEKDNGK